ncbi:Peptide-methionine (R)-S-oxide reductase MsrB [hydrothermal vent metagenome]|uniref:peptide-methionine (R)-S-oxide reductase n=1 Tax=hydrothermal vent metagenome TaxID=652676 RepID=A0A3B0UD10_9ZZZZ
MSKIIKSKEEWQQELTPEQFRVTRKSGTERAGSSPLNDEKRDGEFHCVCCGQPLFDAEAKFDSGTGWPSFFEPVAKNSVTEKPDSSFFRKRTEIVCTNCDAHLGHVFDDGPQPTGLRYCMNGAALNFVAADKK